MVQIIENRAEISGELLSVAPRGEQPGFMDLRVRVIEARSVGDWPNLFAVDIGEIITVVARKDSAAVTAAPGPVTLRVKKTGPGMSWADA